MDQLKGALNSFTGGQNNTQGQQQGGSSSGGGGGGNFLGGLGDKLNSAAGGGRESEKNEDYLDKGKYCVIRQSMSVRGIHADTILP
jgi:hypothetical protein